MPKRIGFLVQGASVLRDIPVRIEKRVWLPPFRRALDEVVNERVHPPRRDIGVARQIPAGAEQRMRITAFLTSEVEEVAERVDLGGQHIGITL